MYTVYTRTCTLYIHVHVHVHVVLLLNNMACVSCMLCDQYGLLDQLYNIINIHVEELIT